MNPFDFSAYLSRQESLVSASDSKKEALQRASLKKTLGLTDTEAQAFTSLASSEIPRGVTREAQEAYARQARITDEKATRNEAALAKDWELDTFGGQVKQNASSINEGSARTAGFLGSLPFTVAAQDNLRKVDDRAIDIYNRNLIADLQEKAIAKAEQDAMIAGIRGSITREEQDARLAKFSEARKAVARPSEEELQYLNQPGQYLSDSKIQGDTDLFMEIGKAFGRGITGQEAKSYRELLDSAVANLEGGRKVSEFFTENDFIKGLVNPLDKQGLDRDLSVTWENNKQSFSDAEQAWKAGDKVSAIQKSAAGVAALVAEGGKDLLNNPAAAVQYMTENLPQLALGGLNRTLLTASNLAYGGDIYAQALGEYRKANDGKMPSGAEAAEMLAWSLSASVAEHVADIGILNQVSKGISKSLPKTFIENVTERISSNLLAKGANKVVNNALGRVAGAAVTGTGREAATEGYQTAVEDGFSQLKSPDMEQVFKGAVIGGGVGGGLSAAGRAAGETVQAAAKFQENQAKAKAERANRPSKPIASDALNQAVETGDVSAFTDPESPTYAPGRAVEALVKRAQTKELTDEQKAETGEAIKTALTGLNAEITTLETRIKEQRTALGLAEDVSVADEVKRLQASLKAMPKDSPDFEPTTRLLEIVESQAADAARLEAGLAQRKQQLQLATDAEKLYTVSTRPKTDDIESLITQTEAPDPTPEREVAASKLVAYAMEDPDFDLDAIERLVNNPKNGLSEAQRATLRTIPAARQAVLDLKTSDEVHSDILYGDKEGQFQGLTQYQETVAQAARNRDTATMQREIAKLKSFAASHANKLAVLQQAIAKAKAEGIPETGQKGAYYLVRHAEKGRWTLETQKPAGWSQADNRGNVVWLSAKGIKAAENTQKLIQKEVKALKASLSQFEAMRGQLTAAPVSGAAPKVDVGPTAVEEPQVPAREQQPPLSRTEAPQTPVEESVPKSGNQDMETTNGEPVPQQESVTDAVDSPTVETETTGAPQASDLDDYDAWAAQADANPSSTVMRNPEQAIPEGPTKSPTESLTELEVEESVTPGFTSDVATPTIPGDAETFRKTNLLFGFFRQEESGERPLNTVKNFLSTWAQKSGLPTLFFPEGVDLSQKQLTYLERFRTAAQALNQRVLANLAYEEKGRDGEFRSRDFVRFFKDSEKYPEGIPENWVTAISYAAFSWAADQASGDGYNALSEIRRNLGRDEKERVTSTEIQALREGTRRHLVVQDLGRRATEVLGVRARADAPADFLTNLQVSLGNHALGVLLQSGWVEQFPVTGIQFSENVDYSTDTEGAEQSGEGFTGAQRVHAFIRVPRDKNRKPTSKTLQNIVAEKKGTHSVLEKLFGADPRITGPVTEAPDFEQAKIKGTNRGVPGKLLERLKTAAKREHGLDTDMLEVLEGMLDGDDNQILKEVLGYRDLNLVQIDERDAQDARNKLVEREVDQLLNLAEEMREQGTDGLTMPLFFTPQVWKPQRVGLASNTVNPQSSKVHRPFIFMKAWETTFDPNQDSESLVFRLAIAQRMGIKVDKQDPGISLAKLDALMDSSVIQDGLASLYTLKHNKDEFTSEDRENILAAVEAGEENAISLLALVEWNKFQEAKAANKPFTTYLSLEVDGLTNGPALSHIMLGVINRELGERFGFYTGESSAQDFITWYADKDNQDLYQNLMSSAMRSLWGMTQRDPEVGVVAKAIQEFTGTLEESFGVVSSAGRNLAKPAVTPTAFGASIKKVLNNTAEVFVDSFGKTLAKVAADPKWSERERILQLRRLVNIWNTRILQGELPVPLPKTVGEALANTGLSPEQRAIAKDTFAASVGKAMEKALRKNFGDFFNARSVVNNAGVRMFQMYDAVYLKAKEALIQQRMDEGTLPFVMGSREVFQGYAYNNEGQYVRQFKTVKETRVPIRELTQKDEQALAKKLERMLPAVHTAMSKESGKISQGLDLFKTANKLVSAEGHTYRAETKFGKEVPVEGEGLNTLSSRGLVSGLQSPGAATSVLGTHSTDSAIASAVYAAFEAMNIHDGIYFGLNDAEAGSQALNQNTYRYLANYSLPMELLRTWDRMLKGIKDSGVELTPEELAPFENARQEFAQKAINMERSKQEYLLEVTTVQQYVLPGSAYTVTAEDKALAEKALLALDKEAERLAIKKDKKEGYQQRQRAREDASNARENPWGAVGTPSALSDNELVAFLEKGTAKTGSMPVKDVINWLGQRLRDQAPSVRVSQFQRALLRQISTILDPNMEVRYITPDSPAPEAGLNVKTARGWYQVDNNSLGIKSPEFVHSSVTAETLLHELIHAALVAKINSNPDHPAVVELTELLKAAREYVDKNPGITGYGPALGGKDANGNWKPADVHAVNELVAWGLTNLGFQQEVLEKVKFASQNRGLVSGLKKFVDGMLQLLFGKYNPEQETAMAALVINAGLVFEQDSRVSPTSRKRVYRQEGAEVEGFTSEQVFDALENEASTLSPAKTQHLKDVLSDVVKAVYGPFGIVPTMAEAQATGKAEDTFLNALATGTLPFVSRVPGHVRLTNQEAFVLESVEASIKEALNGSQVTREQLRRLFDDAKAQLKDSDFYSGDWARATETEKAEAKRIRDFIFTVEKGRGGQSDYLSQFAAMGLVYEPLRNKLDSLKAREVSRDTRTLGQKLSAWFAMAMQYLAEKMTGTSSEASLSANLDALTKNLARIHAKNKMIVQARKDRADTIIDRGGEFLSESIRKGMKTFADSKLVDWAKQEDPARDPNQSTLKTLAGLPRHMAKTALYAAGVAADFQVNEGKLEKMLLAMKRTRDRNFKEPLGFAASVVNEVQGIKDSVKQFYQMALATKKHEQDRKHIFDGHAKLVRDQFLSLSKAASSALTRTVVRLDLAALSDKMGPEQLETLLRNDTVLDAEILKLVKQLLPEHRDFWLVQAKGLGYKLATGITTVPLLAQNAHVMARFKGNDRLQNLDESQAKAMEDVLDRLISLYGMKYLPTEIRDQALEVFAQENRRKDGNGIQFLLALHKQLKQEALERNFGGSPVMVRKGYVKEIFNPHTQVLAATAEEGRIYEQAGYSQGIPLWKDPADPDKEQKYIYAIRGLGMDPRVTGIISTTGERARGTEIHAGITSVTWDGYNRKNKALTKRIVASHQRQANNRPVSGKDFDPARSGQRYMTPIRNEQGEIVNLAYEMEDTTKDNLLERDNRIDQVIGSLASHSFDKALSKVMNRNAVDAFLMQYKADLGTETDAYIEVSENSKDPEIRELYRTLPEDMKAYIFETWGEHKMLVRNDLMNLAFGYRKYSLANIFKDQGADIGVARQTIIKFLLWALNPRTKIPAEDMTEEQAMRELKAVLRIKKTEQVWQEIVRAVKDNWVIKSVFTLGGNIVSNTWVLWLEGVPLTDIVKHQVVALKGVVTYQRDRRRLLQLQRLVDTGTVANLAEVEQEIIAIEDAMRRNPVAPLVDAGLFQTIVEDVEQDNDPYSYKSRLVEFVDQKTQKIPESIKTGAKYLFMTQDTSLYKALNQATTLSDFLARYTLYQHLTTTAKKKQSPQDALLTVSEVFVNYDMPTHKGLQYINDMGLILFTKYYLRVQKTLFRLMREQPGRMLAMSILGNMFPGMPTFLDSGFWNRLDNPLSWGALEYPGSVGEIITVKGALGVVN